MSDFTHGWSVALSVYRNARTKKHGAGPSSRRFALFGALCARAIAVRRPWELHPMNRWPWTLLYGRIVVGDDHDLP